MEKTIKKPVEEKPTVGKADRRINAILSVVLGVLCVAWIYPIVMIFFNSLKTERAITTSRAFELPTAGTFVGLKNYIYGIQEMDFLSSFWYSLVITVSSVVLILLCMWILLLHVRMVHHPCQRQTFQTDVRLVHVQYGGAVPDGHVYLGQNSG